MKTWEVIKALTENPNYIFRDAHSSIAISKMSKKLVWLPESNNKEELPFIIYSNAPGGVDNLHIDWELMPEAVDFMTAANSGKKFKPESWIWEPDDKFRDLYDNLEMFSGRQMVQFEILNGKWYIKEGDR